MAPTSLNHENISIEKIDICNPTEVKNACKLADKIFNLSSNCVPQSSNNDPISDLQVNLFGAINILDAAKDSRGKKCNNDFIWRNCLRKTSSIAYS